MIKTDEQLIQALTLFLNSKNNLSEAEEGILLNQIENYQSGCWSLIYNSQEKLTPEEILQKAREMNKPILL